MRLGDVPVGMEVLIRARVVRKHRGGQVALLVEGVGRSGEWSTVQSAEVRVLEKGDRVDVVGGMAESPRVLGGDPLVGWAGR